MEKYLKKVTSAHCNQPKYMAWLAVLLEMMMDVSALAEDMQRAFSAKEAVGLQQDVAGAILGVSRYVPLTTGQGGDLLTDNEYRRLIKAKVLRNSWDGNLGSIAGLWQLAYPEIEIKYTDNMDMTVNILCQGEISLTMQEMMQLGLILPVPMGVSSSLDVRRSVDAVGHVKTTIYGHRKKVAGRAV